MATDSIRFWDFEPIETGGFTCNCHSTKFGRTDRLEFALSPNPGEIVPDAIAIALSTLCGTSYGEVVMELNVSKNCADAIEAYTHAAVSFAGCSREGAIGRNGSLTNIALNFSGGFDSLAAYSLMPKEKTKLVSMDWGGRFFREELFFRRFNPCIVKTNIQKLGYCRETWTFMGIGMILFSGVLDIGYGAFGGTFENTAVNMVRCPRIATEYRTEPFSFLGIKDLRVTHGITEIGSLMVVLRHAPSLFMDILRSVAAPGSEKLYRKSVLAYIVNKRFGCGIDVPIQNEPLKAAYKFGENMTIDMLCLYEMKHVGREIASKTVSDIPETAEELVHGLDMSFFERLNTNFLGSIPSECQDYYMTRLLKAGIRPYSEEDWYELDEVCKFLSCWHKAFLKRNENAKIGQARNREMIEIPRDFLLEPNELASHWIPVTATLEKSRNYEFTIGQVKVVAGETSQVCVSLYDMRNKVVVSRRTFAISGGNSETGLRCSFETPDGDGDYRIIAYAGMPGKCAGIGVAYMDVKIKVRS